MFRPSMRRYGLSVKAMHPDQVEKLAYLECAYSYDQPGAIGLLSQIDSLTPHPSATDRANLRSRGQMSPTA